VTTVAMNYRRVAWAAALLSLWPLGVAKAQVDCGDDNLLAGLTPVRAQRVVRASTLTDGRVPVDGAHYDVEHAARFVGEDAYVVFDLGAVHTIRALYLQADNNDTYIVSISEDGQAFTPAFRAPAVEASGLQPRVGVDLEWRARFVRLAPEGGDGHFSVSELALYCQRPEPFPPDLQVVASVRKDPLGEGVRRVASWKAALALLAIPLLIAMGRMRPRWRAGLALGLVILGLLAWTRFGRFHEDRVLHPWDAFHYFVGPKYFGELEYTEMYNCLAEHERRQGRGDLIVKGKMRDLRTNVLHPGRWSLSDEARCQADFTPARRAQFEADLEAFRPLFPTRLPFHRMVVDHGYNATPPLTAFLKPFTHFTTASQSALMALAALDLLAYMGALAMMWWGFGPRTAALTSLMVGLGQPWTYVWTGGSVGRAVWFFFLCAGLACLARRRQGLGGTFLTLSGLLRLFPGVFVGGLGLYVLVRAWRERRLSREHRHTLTAIVGTLVVGVAAGAVATGWGAYADFFRTMKGHADLVMGNHVGLQNLLSYVPGARSATVGDPRLSDAYEALKIMQQTARSERAPLWFAAIAASLAVLVAYARRAQSKDWVAVLLASLLLFSSVALSNYDYLWLCALAPLAIASPFRVGWVLGYLALTQFVRVLVQDVEVQHTTLSLLTGVMLVVLVAHYLRTTAKDFAAEDAWFADERAPIHLRRALSRGRPGAKAVPVAE
jgi:hypothetical protein